MQMILYKAVLFCLLLLGAGNRLLGQDSSRTKELPYIEGESLTYVLSYTWGGINTEVGEGMAKLNYSDGYYNPVITGRTYKFYDLFFKVREHFESTFSAATMRPLSFYRKSEEGKHRVMNRYAFDNEKGVINVTVTKGNRMANDTILTLTPFTYDLVTLFYVSRAMDFSTLEEGVKYPIIFAIDRKVYNLYFIYHGREVKKIKGLGTFNTMKFSASLVAGEIFTGKDEIYIWVSDDKNIIPLLFESKVLVGTVTGKLKSWENLKYPLACRIK